MSGIHVNTSYWIFDPEQCKEPSSELPNPTGILLDIIGYVSPFVLYFCHSLLFTVIDSAGNSTRRTHTSYFSI